MLLLPGDQTHDNPLPLILCVHRIHAHLFPLHSPHPHPCEKRVWGGLSHPSVHHIVRRMTRWSLIFSPNSIVSLKMTHSPSSRGYISTCCRQKKLRLPELWMWWCTCNLTSSPSSTIFTFSHSKSNLTRLSESSKGAQKKRQQTVGQRSNIAFLRTNYSLLFTLSPILTELLYTKTVTRSSHSLFLSITT